METAIDLLSAQPHSSIHPNSTIHPNQVRARTIITGVWELGRSPWNMEAGHSGSVTLDVIWTKEFHGQQQ